MKKIGWIIGIIFIVLVGGFFAYRALNSNNSANAAANLPTATVERGTIKSTSSAAGNVLPNQSAIVAWEASGRVGMVNVKVGDKVQANQVLASLDPSALPADIIAAKQTLINAQKTLQNLQTSNLSTAQAQQAVANAQQAMDTANAARADYNAPKLGNQATIDQTRADMLLQQKTVDETQRAYDHLAHLNNTSIKKANAVAKHSAALQKLAQDQATYNSLTSPATQQQIAIADGNVAVAEAQLQDAINQYNQVKGGPSAQDIAAAQAAVDAAQATINQSQLIAPFSGTITDVSVMPGDLVNSGLQAFRIDDISSIYVNLQVAEVDVNNLKVGQDASLTFDAVPNKEYTGKVTEIGVVGASSQGVVTYPVTVQITNPDANVKPGMTAAVSITIAQHANVLMVPNQAIQINNGQRQVMVLYEGQEIPVPVTVGLTNDTMSEVASSGLKEGDEVVINTSGTTTTTGGASRGGGGVFINPFGR